MTKTTTMKNKHKNKQTIGTTEEYIKVCKSLLRLEELERNGWRWIAKDRPHKNKKKYNRKRDRKDAISNSVSFII